MSMFGTLIPTLVGCAMARVAAHHLSQKWDSKADYLDSLRSELNKLVKIIEERMTLHEQYRKLIANGEMSENDSDYVEHLKWCNEEFPKMRKMILNIEEIIEVS